MTNPEAEKFKNGTYKKPIIKKEDFFKGGFYIMCKRLHQALHPFPGTYKEFLSRTDEVTYSVAVGIMWDYIELV
ncbi:MAG: hypothetical protein FWE90_14320 [Defluviitaleaceae bacterium]|nr:hypothetical protein [Defluviitaleaceae bacterium]